MGRSARRRLAACLLAASLVIGSGAFLSPAGADTASSAEIQQALARLNTFRADYGAPPATDDPGMDAGAAAHAGYMALAGGLTHVESPGAPGYSVSGAAAGACGDEAENDSLPDAIDAWMRAPLHALIELGSLGATTLGLGRDGSFESLTCATSLATGPAPVSQPPSFPTTFPRDGGSLPFFTFGGETPDPRAACTDPAAVSGFGLLASFGPAHGAIVSATAKLTLDDGTQLPVCVVDEANAADETTQGILSDAHSVVVFPRDSLQPSTSYTWSTTADGVTLTRHFVTTAAALTVTVTPNPAYPRDLVVSVTSPTGAATGTVTVTLRATSGGAAATAPVVDSGSVQPGTDGFYTNLYVPASLAGQINYQVTASAPGYLASSAAGSLDGIPSTGTTTVTTTTTTTTTSTSITTTPGPAPAAGGSAAAKTEPGCALTAPANISRSHGKVKLKAVQKCHGESGKAKILIQRHQGRKWVTVASPAETLGDATKTWTLTIKAAHNAQFRWVLQVGKNTLVTSRTTVAS